MMLAKALYDNVSDAPEELAFRRGDVLTILEKDTQGLDGWWLCSLRGKRGIVPGNRIKELAGMAPKDAGGGGDYAVPPSHKRQSWHNPNKIVTPQKKGDQYIYEEPKSLSETQDYDVPPSRYLHSPAGSSLPPSNLIYNEPKFDKEDEKFLPLPAPHIYAVPSEEKGQGQMPTSNRSSMTSMFSTGSNSNSGGAESRTSSLDISGQEIYDVPPLAKTVVQNNAMQAGKALPPPAPCANQMNTYDMPRNTKEFSPDRDYMEINDMPSVKTSKEFQSKFIEDYDIPKSDTSRSSGDSGIDTSKLEHLCDIDTDDVYDTPKKAVPVQPYNTPGSSSGQENSPQEGVYDTPKGRKSLHDLYDSPKNLQENTYSVPGSVRSTLVRSNPPSMRTASPKRFGMHRGQDTLPSNMKESLPKPGDSSNRLSSGSSGSDTGTNHTDQLKCDQESAINQLNALIQESHKSATKLLSYVKLGWRRQELLEPKIPVIKESSQYVHRTMRSLVEFGQGALANSEKVDDKKLEKKIQKQLEPLQEALQDVSKCLGNMECSGQWQLQRLVHYGPKEKGDDLDIIVHRTREFPTNVSALASLIKGNAALLFNKQSSPKEETNQDSSAGAAVKRPPPPVKPKPKLGLDQRASLDNDRRSSLQSRPLPTIPKTGSLPSKTDSQDNGAIYNVPKGEKDNENNTEEYDYDYVALSRENSVTESTNNNSVDEAKSPYSKQDPSPNTSVRSNTPEPFLEESDYDMPKSNKPLVTREDLRPPSIRTSGLSPKFRERLEQLQAEAQQPVVMHTDPESTYDIPNQQPIRASRITDNDRQILAYYGEQVGQHADLLLNASDAFFSCCEYNQPPKVFIAHSKFVILAAHKLVYIADAISQCIADETVRIKVMTCANRLCDSLKLTVTATKGAALNFPQILPVQDMVDRVVQVTQAAAALRAEVAKPLNT